MKFLGVFVSLKLQSVRSVLTCTIPDTHRYYHCSHIIPTGVDKLAFGTSPPLHPRRGSDVEWHVARPPRGVPIRRAGVWAGADRRAGGGRSADHTAAAGGRPAQPAGCRRDLESCAFL